MIEKPEGVVTGHESISEGVPVPVKNRPVNERAAIAMADCVAGGHMAKSIVLSIRDLLDLAKRTKSIAAEGRYYGLNIFLAGPNATLRIIPGKKLS